MNENRSQNQPNGPQDRPFVNFHCQSRKTLAKLRYCIAISSSIMTSSTMMACLELQLQGMLLGFQAKTVRQADHGVLSQVYFSGTHSAQCAVAR